MLLLETNRIGIFRPNITGMWDTLTLNMPTPTPFLPNGASAEFQVNFEKRFFYILFSAKSLFKKEIEGRNHHHHHHLLE